MFIMLVIVYGISLSVIVDVATKHPKTRTVNSFFIHIFGALPWVVIGFYGLIGHYAFPIVMVFFVVDEIGLFLVGFFARRDG
ncbi:hypothetical protein [Pseudalkalibacillus caeni]|uniref:Uncharacterized protein n=1 Tax=Exobacillus caeni TaxID=2574798 RepID=A0A5R9F492_9BACL|nr:hypothetical protein [Pseudalkalibacillus caeni]TLS38397.1 hypothetical protein FCL54_04440 [Pseudalkalibacillus caeni]